MEDPLDSHTDLQPQRTHQMSHGLCSVFICLYQPVSPLSRFSNHKDRQGTLGILEAGLALACWSAILSGLL